MNELIEWLRWFFSLEMDAVTLPWVEANKYTIAFILGAPVMAARWYWKTRDQAKKANLEFEKTERGAE
jgi:hypothetical protein